MGSRLATLDYVVFMFYFVVVAGYGWYIYNKKRRTVESSADYFLAEGSLTWWAIGASLIASNISAEQFIGMSADGFQIGLAIATYEWMAAATLLVVAIFFMPMYLKNHIFTMPQFLRQRYSPMVALIMALFWLLLYIVVNLTSILYLGAIAVQALSGLNFTVCMIFLAVFAVFISIGGMKVIGYTDVIQVVFLIFGGLVTTILVLNLVSTAYGTSGAFNGLMVLAKQAPDHFHMIINKDNPNFASLPGLTVLIGGMWITNINYWGFNQYITQRALGANLTTARSGLLFAAFLKLFMPIIIVIPGIAAYVLHQHGMFQTEMLKDGALNKDNAYPVLLNLLGPGLRGLSFAALTAAIVASLAGKANSISTIFTLDIFKNYIKKDASEKQLISMGRIVIVLALIVAIIIAPMLGIDKKGGFSFIQEYTGFISPGVVATFLLGFFWKRTTANAALFGIFGGFVLSMLFKFMPDYVNLSGLYNFGFAAQNATGIYEIPFLDRMGFVFVLTLIGMYIITVLDARSVNNPKGLVVPYDMFKPSRGFAIGAVIVVAILFIIYGYFW